MAGPYTSWQPSLPRYPCVRSELLPPPPAELSQNLPGVSNSFHHPGPPPSVHLLHGFLNAVLAFTWHACSWLWLLHVTLKRDGTVTHSKCSHSKLFPSPIPLYISEQNLQLPPVGPSNTSSFSVAPVKHLVQFSVIFSFSCHPPLKSALL